MALIVLILILCELIATANAFPGEKAIKALHRYWYQRVQQTILGDLYLDYFKTTEHKVRNILFTKIAIHTHIYMLRLKIEQHETELEKLRLNGQTDGLAPSFYGVAMLTLSNIQAQYVSHGKLDEALCQLMIIKSQMFALLEYERVPYIKRVDKEQLMNLTDCDDKQMAGDIIARNNEEMVEWIMGDMLRYFKNKPQLKTYLKTILKQKDVEKIGEAWLSLLNIFGFSKASLICKANVDTLGDICNLAAPNAKFSYELAYAEYFNSDDNNKPLNKWRSKMVIEFNLYNSWLTNLFAEAFDLVEGIENDDNNANISEYIEYKMDFLNMLHGVWKEWNAIFWHGERPIREKMINLALENANKKNAEIDQFHAYSFSGMFEYPRDKLNDLFFWVNGPVDISLYRALSVCIKDAISEHSHRFTLKNIAKAEQIEDILSTKFLHCLGKQMKKAPSKVVGKLLSTLHFNEMSKLGSNSEDFKAALAEHKHLLVDFMENKWATKLEKETHDDEYLSVHESFSESDTFEDAVDEIDNENEEEYHNNKKILPEKTPIKLNAAVEIIQMQNSDAGGEIMPEMDANVEMLEFYKENEFWQKKSQHNKKAAKSKAKNNTKKRGEVIRNKSAKHLVQNSSNVADEQTNLNANKLDENVFKNKKALKINENNEFAMLNNQKNSMSCKETFIKIGINTLSDLLHDFVIKNVFQLFLTTTKFDKNLLLCMEYLHNSTMLIRAIDAQLNLIKNRTKDWLNDEETTTEFDKKWIDFINVGRVDNRRIIFDDETQFVQDKLYFMHNELDEYASNFSTKNIFTERFCKIIDEQKATKIMHGNMPTSSSVKITQFGTYHIDKFDEHLTTLEFHQCSMLIAKEELSFEMIEQLKGAKRQIFKENTNLNFENERGNWCICTCVDIDAGHVKELQGILRQKKLDFSSNKQVPCDYELSQYNLIRTNAENRANEFQLSNEISNWIFSQTDRSKRHEIWKLRQNIATIINAWAAQFTTMKPHLLTSGSLLLNAYIDGSDMDLLCVMPDQIELKHFYGQNDSIKNLQFILKQVLPDVISVNWIPGKVGILRIDHRHVEVDLLPVIVPANYLAQTNLHIEADELIKQLTNESTIYPLAGYRSAKYLLSIVPNHKHFAILLKAVKIWAKNRLIYSGLFGYFNGATLSVMAAKICIIYPQAPLTYLLQQFFAFYSKWKWTERSSVLVEKFTPIALNPIVRKWPPIFGISPMNIITPKFPEQNAAFNVNNYTLPAIINELKIASDKLLASNKNWTQIFEERKFKEIFGHFAIILCSSMEFDEFTTQCAFERSRIRDNLLNWATANQQKLTEMVEQFHLIPQSEQKFVSNSQNVHAFCRLWIVGITLKSEYKEINLNQNLAPIYQNGNHKRKFTRIQSFYTNVENLETAINNLRSHLET